MKNTLRLQSRFFNHLSDKKSKSEHVTDVEESTHFLGDVAPVLVVERLQKDGRDGAELCVLPGGTGYVHASFLLI